MTPKRGMGGRPTLLTEDRHVDIVLAVSNGVSPEVAAVATGVSDRTYYSWMSRGRNGEEPFLQFRQDVEKAKVRFESQQLRVIMDAGHDGKWQAAAWLLERKYPQRYALNRNYEREDAPLTELDELTEEELIKIVSEV